MFRRRPPTIDSGRQAEDLALEHLRDQGLQPVERNYRSRFGEIDLIMLDGSTLVFVEVRFRSSDRFGGALASVDHRKQMKLIQCARHYIADKNEQRCMRFDVVAISPDDAQHAIEWIADAFQT